MCPKYYELEQIKVHQQQHVFILSPSLQRYLPDEDIIIILIEIFF